jgi:hypothetical protein
MSDVLYSAEASHFPYTGLAYFNTRTVEPGYNDIDLHDTSPIESDIQW